MRRSDLHVLLTATGGVFFCTANLVSIHLIKKAFSFPRKDKDFRRKRQMEPSVWTIMATVPPFTFVLAAVTLGNSPINQLCSGCHRLDLGQSHLSLRGRPGSRTNPRGLVGGGGPSLKLGTQQWQRWGSLWKNCF